MSLGGSVSSSLDTAVANTVAAGYTVVVAGGNNDGPVTRPADCIGVMAVGAVGG